MAGLIWRLIIGRFDRSGWNVGGVLWIGDEALGLRYFPFLRALCIPLREIRATRWCLFRWYSPFPALRIEYVENGNAHSLVLTSYGSLRPIQEWIARRNPSSTSSGIRHPAGFLWVLPVLAHVIGMTLFAKGFGLDLAAYALFGTLFANNLVYRAWFEEKRGSRARFSC